MKIRIKSSTNHWILAEDTDDKPLLSEEEKKRKEWIDSLPRKLKSVRLQCREEDAKGALEETVPRITNGKVSGQNIYDRFLQEINSGKASFVRPLILKNRNGSEWHGPWTYPFTPETDWAEWKLTLKPENVTFSVFYMAERGIFWWPRRLS